MFHACSHLLQIRLNHREKKIFPVLLNFYALNLRQSAAINYISVFLSPSVCLQASARLKVVQYRNISDCIRVVQYRNKSFFLPLYVFRLAPGSIAYLHLLSWCGRCVHGRGITLRELIRRNHRLQLSRQNKVFFFNKTKSGRPWFLKLEELWVF